MEDGTNNYGKDEFHYMKNTKSVKSMPPFSWVKNIRALPSRPEDNDYLKPEYIEVNLNNSRKLIRNLDHLTKSIQRNVESSYKVNESLLQVQSIRHNLSWLDDV